MLRFDGGSVSSGSQISMGIKAFVGMDITPANSGDWTTSDSSTFNLSNSTTPGQEYENLKGHHFSQFGDPASVDILGGVGDWEHVVDDAKFPGWGSVEQFTFWYRFGGFSGGSTAIQVLSMLPIWSGGGPDLLWEDDTVPSWITEATGATTGLTTTGTAKAMVYIEVTFVNGKYEATVKARKYGC
jgi:hypothetical protein